MKTSKELLEVTFFALDHAVESLRAGGPLVPFVIVETASGRKLARFVAETLEGSIEQARRCLRGRTDVPRAELAYDGYFTLDGTRYDAVLVEAHEAGLAAPIMLCQRYEPKRRFRPLRTIGNPGDAGEAAPLLEAF